MNGIRMIRPREGDVFHRGGSISINYRFIRVVLVAGGDIVFSLMDENGDEVVSTTVKNTYLNYSPRWYYREVVLEVPGNVSYGEYHILASHSASGAEGESDVFSIQGIGEGHPGHPGTPSTWAIQNVTPGRVPVSWPRGSIKLITWRIDGAYPSERAFLVTLMRGAESVRTFSAGRAVWKGIFETYSLNCIMPTDIPLASDYRIKVVDRNGPTEGISEREFSVTRPICGIEVGLVDLEVHSLHLSSGFLYRVGQPLNFRISSSGMNEVTAQLVPVEEQFRWRWSIPLRDSPFITTSLSWTPPPEVPVGDYRIYVTGVIPGCATGTSYAYSEAFHLYAPIPDPVYEINVTYPHGQIVIFTSNSPYCHLSWSGWFPTDALFTRILYKGSVELQRIGPDVLSPDYYDLDFNAYVKYFNVNGYASGSDYHVRVEVWSLDGTELLASDNTENFTLMNRSTECSTYQPLIIVSPNNSQSEVRVIGRPLSIEWFHYPDASPDHRIRLLLVRDTAFGGGEWEINSSIPSFPCQTTWVIPTSVPPGDGYRVRAEQIGGTGVATSERTFSISNP